MGRGGSFYGGGKNYIEESKTLKVVSLVGIAPLGYIDSKGNIKGIGINLFNEISKLTGLDFEYELYASVSDSLASGFDIYINAEKKYAPDDMLLSQPYLESEAILYYNKFVDPKQLGNKKYASVAGGSLPERIKEEQTIYYNDRADAIEAVDSGEADYGFGNAYSLAFYIMQNAYKNIVTIPTGKEERAYCAGVPEGNDILLSIINKSIAAIDKNRIDTLVLDVASQVERKITIPMIIESYWKEVFSFLIVVLAMLGYIVFLTIHSKKRIATENERYKIVAQIADDYLFEYRVNKGRLYISEKLDDKLDDKTDVSDLKERIKGIFEELTKNYDDNVFKKNISIIELPFRGGGTGIFKAVFSFIKNTNGKIYSIVGKLVDITEEEKEKERLVTEAQLDGLTGLYNMAHAKKTIMEAMKKKTAGKLDALIIMDCDKFKDINDRYGHLEGNKVLKNIAKSLKTVFGKGDIIGRFGGDEFCVYMHDIPTADFARDECQRLVYSIQELNAGLKISISVGIAIFEEQTSYEKLFQKADKALYMAKKNTGSQIIIDGEYKKTIGII